MLVDVLITRRRFSWRSDAAGHVSV